MISYKTVGFNFFLKREKKKKKKGFIGLASVSLLGHGAVGDNMWWFVIHEGFQIRPKNITKLGLMNPVLICDGKFWNSHRFRPIYDSFWERYQKSAMD